MGERKIRDILQVKVVEIHDYNPLIREIVVSCPEAFKFKAGQFVMLQVPGGEKPVQRAYSIASSDQRDNGFHLIFKFVEGGLASQYVWKLRVGDQVAITGPFGRLFFQEPPTEQVILLNTGSGISQHFCFLESYGKKYPETRFHLFFGVRTQNDIYYRSELERLQSEVRSLRFHYVLSRPIGLWDGKKGYVQDHIGELNYTKVPTTFYLCGNKAMIDATKAVLNKAGFDAKRVFAEAFD